MSSRQGASALQKSMLYGVVRATLAALAIIAGAPTTAVAAVPDYHGVQLHSLWWDSSSSDMDRELDLSRDAHANVVRVDVSWSSLETGGDGQFSQWYVDKLDRFMAGANARGMKVIATLFESPCWASSAPDSLKQGCQGDYWNRGVTEYPPINDADYAKIARWVTSRYGADLAALEIWNEPNMADGRFWVSDHPAQRYAQLVKAAYPQAKAGDPSVPVLAGALAFSDRPFLAALYAAGIKGSYDGLSIHAYSEARGPRETAAAQFLPYTFTGGLQSMHAAQSAAGDPTPIWVTEFGWTSGAGKWHVDDNAKARFVADAFGALGDLPWVKAASVYNLRDKGTDPGDFEDNFGLVRRDFTPKPAYAALKTVLGGGQWAGPAGVAATPETPITLRLRSRGGVLYAGGLAPASRVVHLKLSGSCRRRAGRRLSVKVGAGGRWQRRIDRPARIAGCRLVATVHP
jgi:hypothetical protein